MGLKKQWQQILNTNKHAKSSKNEDPYSQILDQSGPLTGLEDLLKSPEYSKHLNSQIEQMMQNGLSEAEIISKLSQSLDIVDRETGELSRRGFEKSEQDLALNPEIVKKNYKEGVQREREKVKAIGEIVKAGEEDSELAREARERENILKIVEENADNFSEQFAKKAQKSIQTLSDQIEEARDEFREFVEDSPDHLIVDEDWLDSALGQKTVQRLMERLPEDEGAIQSTIDELTGADQLKNDVEALLGTEERKVERVLDGKEKCK